MTTVDQEQRTTNSACRIEFRDAETWYGLDDFIHDFAALDDLLWVAAVRDPELIRHGYETEESSHELSAVSGRSSLPVIRMSYASPLEIWLLIGTVPAFTVIRQLLTLADRFNKVRTGHQEFRSAKAEADYKERVLSSKADYEVAAYEVLKAHLGITDHEPPEVVGQHLPGAARALGRIKSVEEDSGELS